VQEFCEAMRSEWSGQTNDRKSPAALIRDQEEMILSLMERGKKEIFKNI